MRRWLFALMLLPMLASAQAASVEQGHALVVDTATHVLDIIRERKAEFDKDPNKIYALVNEVVIPHFDFQRISRWVLARHWRKASASQRQRFVDEFRTLMVRTYAKALIEYTDQKIDYLPLEAKPDAERIEVRSEVEQPGGFPIPIDYRLHQVEGEWKVYDVNIDGVSLVANYRTTFGSEINREGMDNLIKRLGKRNTQAMES